MADALREGATSTCTCGDPITVTNVRTGKEFVGPFWRLAWTHDEPMIRTDPEFCYAPRPMARPRQEGTNRG